MAFAVQALHAAGMSNEPVFKSAQKPQLTLVDSVGTKREWLVKLRKIKRLNQKELADLIKVSAGYISRIELGTVTPAARVISRLEQFFNFKWSNYEEVLKKPQPKKPQPRKWLSDLRKAAKMTRQDLADRILFSMEQIGHVERGESNPGRYLLKALEKEFGIKWTDYEPYPQRVTRSLVDPKRRTWLIEIRVAADKVREEVAEAVGIKCSYYAKIELGNCKVTEDLKDKISKFLEFDKGYFDTGGPPPKLSLVQLIMAAQECPYISDENKRDFVEECRRIGFVPLGTDEWGDRLA